MLQSLSDLLQWSLGLDKDVADVNALEMALRAIAIYVFSLLLVRLGSKRLLGQASAFDVVVGVILGSVMSRAINGSAPLVPTLVAGAAIVGVHWSFALIAFHTSFFGPFVKGHPRLLIENGKIQEAAMRRAKLTPLDLEEALRLQSNQTDIATIHRAYLERSGTISVVPYSKEPQILDISVEKGVQNVRVKLE